MLPTTLQVAVGTTPGVPDGDEGTAVTVGLIVTGGKFDSYTQEWSVLLGSDNVWGGADDTETIDWTRPRVALPTRNTSSPAASCSRATGLSPRMAAKRSARSTRGRRSWTWPCWAYTSPTVMASKVYVGNQLADKVYIGNVEIWSKS